MTIKISAYIFIACKDFTRRISLELLFNFWDWSRSCKEVYSSLGLEVEDLTGISIGSDRMLGIHRGRQRQRLSNTSPPETGELSRFLRVRVVFVWPYGDHRDLSRFLTGKAGSQLVVSVDSPASYRSSARLAAGSCSRCTLRHWLGRWKLL